MSESSTVVEATLPNGLMVLLREDRSAPLVSTWTWYRVGSRNEHPGLTGVSHWVEHMQFKGTPSLAKGQIFRDVSRHGGVLNAMTSHDWTAYFETLPAAQADLALRIESDRMTNSLFDPEETESERTVILSERQGAENNPGYLLYEEVVGAAFRSHPYRHMVIGHECDLRTITRDDLYGHYRQHYHPANAFIVAVGDFDAAEMLDKVAKSFGDIPAGAPVPPVRIGEPPQQAERRVLLQRPSPAGYLRMVFHAPGAEHPDTAALLVADAVLSGGKGMGMGGGGAMGRSARLYRSLVDARLARSAGSDFGLSVDPYLFAVAATALEGVGLQRIEDVIDAEIDRLREDLVPSDELARARKQVKAQYVYSGEGVTNQAFWLGQMEIVDSWRRAETLVDELEAVTPDDIRRVAQTWLRPDQRTVGWLVPSETGSGSTDPVEGEAASYRVWGLGGVNSHRFERDVLDDGIVVLGQARPSEPSVSVRIRVEAGAVLEPDTAGGTATITARMLTRGGGGLSAPEINEFTDALGSSLGADAGRNSSELSFRCLAEDLPTMLGLAGRLLTAPDFPDDELEKVRAQLLVGIREAENDTRSTADRIMRRALYPEPNPLGRRVSGDAASVRGITRDDLVAFYQANYAPGRLTVAMVGGVPSFAAARDLVEETFTAWGQDVPPASNPALEPISRTPSRHETWIAGKSQADVAVGFPTVERLHPDYYALDLANLVLGRLGLMGRLGANVRDRQGLAYYAFSQIEAGREGSVWTGRAGVDPANVDRAIEAILDEVAALRREGVTEEELSDAKSYLIGILPLALETNDGVASTLLAIEHFGLGLDYVDRYPSIISALSRDEVREAASRHLDESRMVIGIAGPATDPA